MLKLHLQNGTAWTTPIQVEGHTGDDIISLIDDYYYENGSLPVPMYTMDELEEWELATMIPVNGGEYYIDMVSYIEELAI